MTGSNGPYDTHEVLNQPPPLADYDVFATDRCLAEALEREGAGWAHDRLSALADAFCATRLTGGAPPQAHGALPPGLALADIVGYARTS